MKAGDAEHGVVDAVAFQATVAEDLPGLHAGEGVLDTGANVAVRSVVVFPPGWQFALPAPAAVRDDQAGAPIAPIGDHGGAADGFLGSGQCPRLAVVGLPGNGRPTTATRRVSASMTT